MGTRRRVPLTNLKVTKEEIYITLTGIYRCTPDRLAEQTMTQLLVMYKGLMSASKELVFNNMNDYMKWKAGKNG